MVATADRPRYWVDGEPATALPLPDRGLDFGDGLFETLLLRQGQPLFLEQHLQRLQRGTSCLRFPDILSRARAQILAAAAASVDLPWAALRLTLTRGAGPRGYVAPVPATPRLVVAVSAIARDCSQLAAPAHIDWAQLRWGSQPALAGIKHLNRLEQVLAADEARAAGLDEVLLKAQDGRPVSVGAGNLFIVKDERLLTPELDDCGIAGTRRELVLTRWAQAAGVEAAVTLLTVADVENASEVFYCNSLQGLRPVAALAGRRWQQYPVTERLHQCLLAELLQ